jgi:hypothetical protein
MAGDNVALKRRDWRPAWVPLRPHFYRSRSRLALRMRAALARMVLAPVVGGLRMERGMAASPRSITEATHDGQ